MRLHLGPVPESPDFQPELTGWQRLREPSAGVFMVAASAVGLVAGGLMVLAWIATASGQGAGLSIKFSSGSVGLAVLALGGGFLGGLMLLIVVHELLHAAVFPGRLFGPRTIIGFWPQMGAFYAHYHGSLSRGRYLLTLVMPFLILTVGTWLAAAIVPTRWNSLLAIVSVLNAMFAGGDLLGAALIAAQTPAGSELRNQGWKTWWRVPTAAEGERKAC